MKSAVYTLLAGLAFAVAVPAQAQFAKPEDAIRYRQSAFVLMGNHMGRINGQLKADKPDVAAIQHSAAIVEFASKLPYEAFVPNTETGGTPPTRVKPEAFKDAAKVGELRDKMQAEVVKLSTVAKGGDIAAIRAQFGATGKSCKACHDDYRKE